MKIDFEQLLQRELTIAMTETKQWKDDYDIVQTSKKLSKAIYLDLAKHIKLQNDEALSCYFLIKSEEIDD